MSSSFLKEYERLLEFGSSDEIDDYVNHNSDGIGYNKVTWHIWRFRRFNTLEPLRASLLTRFDNGEALNWQALEALYYLQENRITGDPVADQTIRCPAIFRALCRSLQGNPNGRKQALRFHLVWFGLIDKDNELRLPAFTEEEAAAHYHDLPLLDRLLMECGRINRSSEEPLALHLGNNGGYEWTAHPESKRLVELYIGPYFFCDLDAAQRTNACLPDAFKSPFREGLHILTKFFMHHGWSVMPWLTWRGGLAPECQGRGKFSFCYHSHGQIPGRWHYKFGHFSNLMQIDNQGYAGFSSLAMTTREDIMRFSRHLDDSAIEKALEQYRIEYITRRFTWRVQSDAPITPLDKGRTTLFFPLQDPFDEVATLAHVQPGEIVQVLRDVTHAEDRIHIKRHPVDKSQRTTRLIADLEGDPRFIISDAPIHDLFAISDLVVTVNSGVGFEALLAGLPVIACGKSDYNLATTTVKNAEELRDALLYGNHPCPAWRQRFLHHYFEHYIYDPRDPRKYQAMLAAALGMESISIPKIYQFTSFPSIRESP